jgi:hypothetical protein
LVSGDNRDPASAVRQADRGSSLSALERMFDVGMMILFGLLGLFLTVVGFLLPYIGFGILGGLLVMGTVLPLWLGGRPATDRPGRNLKWYPIAAVTLAVGLLVWVHPWTG